MRRILTAVLALAAVQASAEQHMSTPVVMTDSARVDGLFRSGEVSGADIYSIDPESGYDWSGQAELEGVSAEWEDIGEVEDLVIDSRGQVVGVVAEVGGFLGLGDKQVVIPIGEVRLAPDEDGEIAFVTRLGEDLLEEWPSVGADYWE